MNTLPALAAHLRAQAALNIPLSPARMLVLARRIEALAPVQKPHWAERGPARFIRWGERVWCEVGV